MLQAATWLVTLRHGAIMLRQRSRLPPFANTAKDGPPTVSLIQRVQRLGHPPDHPMFRFSLSRLWLPPALHDLFLKGESAAASYFPRHVFRPASSCFSAPIILQCPDLGPLRLGLIALRHSHFPFSTISRSDLFRKRGAGQGAGHQRDRLLSGTEEFFLDKWTKHLKLHRC